MSIHKRVLRVTDEADRLVREFAEEHGGGVYDTATGLLLWALDQKALSEAINKLVDDPPEPTEHLIKMFRDSPIAPTPAPDPRVTAYAEETGATYADALDKLVRLGISRARALDKHAAGKRAA